MSELEQDVRVDCEIEETLLDTWLQKPVVERFLDKLAKRIVQCFPGTGRAEAFADMLTGRVYRFIVPPFLAFVSLGCCEVDDARDLWVDMDQFLGKHTEPSQERMLYQIQTCRASAQPHFFHSERDVPDDLPVGKTTTITLNPVLRDDPEMDGESVIRISVTECCKEKDRLSFSVRGESIGSFTAAKACASLSLSMKRMLCAIEKKVQGPVARALIRTEEVIGSVNESLKDINSVETFVNPQPSILRTDPLSSFCQSLQSDLRALRDLERLIDEPPQTVQFIPPFPNVSPSRPSLAMSLYLTRESGEDDTIFIVNPTVFSYPSVTMRLVSADSDVLEIFNVRDILPGTKEAIFTGQQVNDLLQKGGVLLQLDSSSSLSLT